MQRRNMLIGLGTIVLGTSGFIASGAFNFGSEGSVGSEWVQVAGVDEVVAAEETDQDATVGTGGDGGGDDGGPDGGGSDENDEDGAGDDEEEDETTETPTPSPTPTPTSTPTPTPTPTTTSTPTSEPTSTPTPSSPSSGGSDSDSETETRVQVVTDPSRPGNLVDSLGWHGRMTGSEFVVGDSDGFFERFSVGNTNRNAVSRVGIVDSKGYPSNRIAFLVGNVGDPETPGLNGHAVDVELQLLDENGTDLGAPEQLNFPYRVVDPNGQNPIDSRGHDLLEDTVSLPVGLVIEVIIEIDSRTDFGDTAEIEATFDAIEWLQFAADSAGDL